VVAVVTRYFGGVKLGAGGLVRAYSGATTLAVDEASLVAREKQLLFTLPLAHADAGRIEGELRIAGVTVLGTEYGSRAVLTLAAADPERLAATVAAVTAGAGELAQAGHMWIDV
jgi:putative IMPACT (imprinted ancient) family translation regulator